MQPARDTSTYIDTYSEPQHWAILAMWCATSHCPTKMILDKYHKMEVKMLCPKVQLPSNMTVLRNMRLLHKEIGTLAKECFKVQVLLSKRRVLSHITCRIERATFTLLQTDGQCQRHHPTSASLLSGMRTAKYTAGSSTSSGAFTLGSTARKRSCLHRLTKSHTGKYMAKKTHQLLSQWGIQNKVSMHPKEGGSNIPFVLSQLLAWAMDNASVCNKTAVEYVVLAPTWRTSLCV